MRETISNIPTTVQRRVNKKPNPQWKVRTENVGTVLAYIIALALIFGSFVVKVQYPDDEYKNGCVSIKYKYRWMPDINFKTYVEDHTKEIFQGRMWLFKNLTRDLQTNGRGILLAADMGYGKSAIISHMVCANTTSHAFQIKKHILYYHICKFDILLTQRVDIFIKRLSTALMENIPSFGNIINMDKTAMTYLESSVCAEDPSGCFQHLLFFPLRRIENQKDQYIVIDALDECYEEENTQDRFSLLNILAYKADTLPPWIKFVFTSRNVKHVLSKFRFLRPYHLETSDERNLLDIEAYLKSRDITRSVPKQSSIGIRSSDVTKADIKSVSNGNFLFVIHALEFCVTPESCIASDFPKTLDKLLEANFDRVFGQTLDAYKLPKQIFEVICTSSKPLLQTELIKILNCTSNDCRENFEKLLRTKLSHFLRVNNGTTGINHKAICDFLSNADDKDMPYSISRSNGHKMHAHHLFFQTTVKQVTTESIIELISHVSESSDTDLTVSFQKHFRDVIYIWIKDLPEDKGTLLHELSRSIDSYAAVVLLLKVLDNSSVNATDYKGATPAFLAASFGNTDTLKAILDHGGNIRHRIQKEIANISSFVTLDRVKVRKLVTNMGYGILDIAAQNGHSKTVEVLLKRDKKLACERNGIGLNAVHLAAEYGHTKIVQLLLNVNISLADKHALYLASRNGHVETVETLLKLGIRDSCVRCNGTTYWLDKDYIKLEPFVYLDYRNISSNVFVYDDEMFLKCETALEVAIQFGYFDIVKLILAKTPKVLHCREYGGRTAILTAIKYNRTDIFGYLLKSGANLNDRCQQHNDVNDMVHQMESTEYTDFIKERCSNGSGLPHFIAMYGRSDMLKTIFFNHNRSTSFWNIRDSSNASALHYAACHNNIVALFHLIEIIKSSLQDTTFNGSTPYHSAIACRAILSLMYLMKYHGDGFVYVDSDNRNLLHYLSFEPFTVGDEYLYIAHILSNTQNKHWCNFDSNGNSFLHYAAISGNHHLTEMVKYCAKNVTLTPNNKGMNVYELAVSILPVTSPYVLKIPKNCYITEMFSSECNVESSDILSPHEMFLIRLLYNANTLKTPNLTSLISDIIRRGNAPATLFLRRYMVLNYLTIDYERLVPDLFMSDPNVLIIDAFLIYGTFSCRKPFLESFLHRLLMNENGKYWYCATYLKESLQVAIAKKSVREWNQCFDAEGYNILHRAAMGGHLAAVKFLLNRGLSIKVSPRNSNTGSLLLEIATRSNIPSSAMEEYKQKYDELEMVIFKGQKHDRYWNLLLNNETKNFDETFVLLVTLLRRESMIEYITLCNERTYNLSIIHVIAARGMLRSLKRLKFLFSSEILVCKNMHDFTPRYFAQVFNHSRVIKFFDFKGVKLKMPKSVPKLIFLLTLFLDKSNFQKRPPWFSDLIEFAEYYEHSFRYFNSVLFMRRIRDIFWNVGKLTSYLKDLNNATNYLELNAFKNITSNNQSTIFTTFVKRNLVSTTSYVDVHNFIISRSILIRSSEKIASMTKIVMSILLEDIRNNLFEGTLCWKGWSYGIETGDNFLMVALNLTYVQVIQFYANRHWIAKSFEAIHPCEVSEQMSFESVVSYYLFPIINHLSGMNHTIDELSYFHEKFEEFKKFL